MDPWKNVLVVDEVQLRPAIHKAFPECEEGVLAPALKIRSRDELVPANLRPPTPYARRPRYPPQKVSFPVAANLKETPGRRLFTMAVVNAPPLNHPTWRFCG